MTSKIVRQDTGTVNNNDDSSNVYSWFSWPLEYASSWIFSTEPQHNVDGYSGSSENLITKGSLLDRSMRFSDSFEEKFMTLANSACVGSKTNSTDNVTSEHSIHSVHIPSNIEDWTTFAASLPDTVYPRYKMVLPKKTKILALDLDETLVHSTSKSSSDCDYFVEVLVDKSSCLYYVFKRPFVDRFLEEVSKWYHLVIYTASLREYAEPVVNWLDRGRGLFKKRLFRTACMEQMGVFIKNLALVDPDLSRVCLVDNSPASFLMHPDNGIPIESWAQDKTDTCLLDMLPFLDALRFVDDVRSVLSLRRIQLASM